MSTIMLANETSSLESRFDVFMERGSNRNEIELLINDAKLLGMHIEIAISNASDLLAQSDLICLQSRTVTLVSRALMLLRRTT